MVPKQHLCPEMKCSPKPQQCQYCTSPLAVSTARVLLSVLMQTNLSYRRGCQASWGWCRLYSIDGGSCLSSSCFSLSGRWELQKEPMSCRISTWPSTYSQELDFENQGTLPCLGRALDKIRQLYLHPTQKTRPLDGAHQWDSWFTAHIFITAMLAGASKHSASSREQLCPKFCSFPIQYTGADTHTQRYPRQWLS